VSQASSFLQRLRSRGLAKDRSGATAVEFALVAGPLFLMLCAVLELGFIFLLSATLDNATASIARTIRTGSIGPNATADTFRDKICEGLGWLQGRCESELSVDVRTFANFSNMNPPNPVTESGAFDKGQLVYQPGGPGDIVLVRAFYPWKLLTPYLSGGLSRLDDGSALMTAATTFRNEPYAGGQPAGAQP